MPLSTIILRVEIPMFIPLVNTLAFVKEDILDYEPLIKSPVSSKSLINKSPIILKSPIRTKLRVESPVESPTESLTESPINDRLRIKSPIESLISLKPLITKLF